MKKSNSLKSKVKWIPVMCIERAFQPGAMWRHKNKKKASDPGIARVIREVRMHPQSYELIREDGGGVFALLPDGRFRITARVIFDDGVWAYISEIVRPRSNWTNLDTSTGTGTGGIGDVTGTSDHSGSAQGGAPAARKRLPDDDAGPASKKTSAWNVPDSLKSLKAMSKDDLEDLKAKMEAGLSLIAREELCRRQAPRPKEFLCSTKTYYLWHALRELLDKLAKDVDGSTAPTIVAAVYKPEIIKCIVKYMYDPKDEARVLELWGIE